MQFLVVKKRSVILSLLLLVLVFSASLWIYLNMGNDAVVHTSVTDSTREIHLVTGEFEATTKEGKEIEAYRFDPGTIFLQEGEKVKLRILGINGANHPFIIEGTNISGKILQGEETELDLQFQKKGVYRLVCLTHHDTDSNGPMTAYIVVN